MQSLYCILPLCLPGHSCTQSPKKTIRPQFSVHLPRSHLACCKERPAFWRKRGGRSSLHQRPTACGRLGCVSSRGHSRYARPSRRPRRAPTSTPAERSVSTYVRQRPHRPAVPRGEGFLLTQGLWRVVYQHPAAHKIVPPASPLASPPTAPPPAPRDLRSIRHVCETRMS